MQLLLISILTHLRQQRPSSYGADSLELQHVGHLTLTVLVTPHRGRQGPRVREAVINITVKDRHEEVIQELVNIASLAIERKVLLTN